MPARATLFKPLYPQPVNSRNRSDVLAFAFRAHCIKPFLFWIISKLRICCYRPYSMQVPGFLAVGLVCCARLICCYRPYSLLKLELCSSSRIGLNLLDFLLLALFYCAGWISCCRPYFLFKPVTSYR